MTNVRYFVRAEENSVERFNRVDEIFEGVYRQVAWLTGTRDTSQAATHLKPRHATERPGERSLRALGSTR